MTRLLIHVEGETEETFVNEVLKPHLYGHGYTRVSARLMGNARERDRRGGARAWTAVRKDILNHLREDSECLATIMVDYYGLPKDGPKAWPGRLAAAGLPYASKAAAVQDALLADISAEDGCCDASGECRFIPYVVMHEFEALLFSDCVRFATSIGRLDLAPQFQAIRDLFPSPEDINDSPITAPSKRVEALVAGYEKPLFGNLAALDIGLDAIRAECPLFNNWLQRLETAP
jgi:Domain of unknown function (DUF4276)